MYPEYDGRVILGLATVQVEQRNVWVMEWEPTSTDHLMGRKIEKTRLKKNTNTRSSIRGSLSKRETGTTRK